MFFSYKDIFRDAEKIAMRHSIWVPNKLETHTHDFFEIAYVIKGSGYHCLNGARHNVKTGDLFLLTPNGQHNFIADENGLLEWINCMFLPDVIDAKLIGITSTMDLLQVLVFFDTFQYDTSSLSGIELHNNIEDLNKIFKDMTKEYSECVLGYQEALKNYLQILLIKIFRAYFIQADNKKLNETSANITNIVMTYLREISFKQNINIEDMAKQAFYSPKHFRKLFQEESGVPLSSFIREKRLDAACDLLTESDCSVSSIMEQVGFNDAKSFYNAFAKSRGMTPAAYRTKYKICK